MSIASFVTGVSLSVVSVSTVVFAAIATVSVCGFASAFVVTVAGKTMLKRNGSTVTMKGASRIVNGIAGVDWLTVSLSTLAVPTTEI